MWMQMRAFTLGSEEYAIGAVTAMPNALVCPKGVINRRGSIVPLGDRRIRFNLGTPTYGISTVVIILDFGSRAVGIVVDSVSDVVTLVTGQVKPAPEMGSAVNADYLTGLGILDDHMLILLDIERLMSRAELCLIQKLAA
jgi:purine-binding chemotaxis protein CheW